jgi:hypothetical protein
VDRNWTWYYKPVIPVLGKLWQDDHEFKASLSQKQTKKSWGHSSSDTLLAYRARWWVQSPALHNKYINKSG